ncbi:MAG: phenylpyruvate tautomerase PptA (4-oxalocrotonate tautomerase family) [Pseudohongiellaceae bacterium]|jgi:phenylpyruvate tautomerase PptA (4-oxalocrotonate tautomerase family)
MPLIRITAQEGTFDKATQNKFIEEVTDAVLTAEGADPKDPAAQSLAWAYYTEQQQGDIYIGKENIDTPPVLIRVTTPAGALDQAANNALAKSINDIINDFIGIFDGRLNHWLLIDEIPTTGWASNGIIFSLKDVRSAMKIS